MNKAQKSRFARRRNDDEDQPAADEPARLSKGDSIGTIDAAVLPREAVGYIAPNKFHAVNDKELKQFISLARPRSMAFAAIFAGIFLGTGYQAYELLMTVTSAGNAEVGSRDLTVLGISAGSLGMAVCAGCFALYGRAKLVKTVDAVRQRSKVYLPPGHPAGPSL